MTLTEPELLAGYRAATAGFDELFADDGSLRPAWSFLAGALSSLGSAELRQRQREIARLLRDDGVTYHIHGQDPTEITAGPARWAVDLVPVLIESEEWLGLEQGMAQRAELLDAVLADLYGPRTLVTRGLVPPELVFGHDGFLRPADQVHLPGTRQLPLYAADLVRGPDGRHLVLADRTQVPSGAAYALENRNVISKVLPSLHREAGVHRLAPYFRALRAALTSAAPPGTDEPRTVVLSPGRWNETYFEHALLARTLGATLVEGADLVVRDGRVWLTALGGLEPVHVVLRRVDDRFCDPLELRPDSQIGVPGLLEAARRGTVTIVNPLGSGLLENGGLLPFLPNLCEALLGEELRLGSVPTWWCGRPDDLRYVLDHFDDLTIKPIARRMGRTSVFTHELAEADRARLRERVEREPHRWIGQAMVPPSSLPTLLDGRLEARPSLLRAFAVGRDDDYVVMPGGLTRVGASRDDLVISGQVGAISKDTWVLSSEPEQTNAFWLLRGPGIAAVDPAGSMSARAAENLFWLGRYAERAEGTIRLMRTVFDRRNEFATGVDPAGRACVEGLLGALTRLTATYPGFVGPDGRGDVDLLATPEHELRALLLDHARPGSLASDVQALLAAANAVRDQLSSDTWMVVANLERELDQLAAGSGEPLAEAPLALANILKSLLALSGLATESMVRDPGWQFLDAGRRVERAVQLVTLLDATVLTPRTTAADSLMLESVLTTAESIITYRRRYRARAQLETVLDLLLLDETNPRSVVYQLERLAEDLAAMPHPELAGRLPLEQRLVLDAATATKLADTELLARAGDGEHRTELAGLLAHLATTLRATSDAIDGAHFVHVLPFQPMVDTVTGPGSAP